MNKFIIIGIVAAVLLVGGGGAAYYFLVMTAETDGAESAPKVDDRAFIYVEIPPVVANFDVKGKMRYVQITTSLQTRDTVSSQTIKDNIPLIQSDLLTLMQGAEFDELNAPDSKKQFIKLIETSVNNIFKDGSKPFEMERAMITGFVIQ
ncbi:flagellar basal body-associated FliL family protein [Pseudomonadales bacterium]|nr:flagellar basal body-associated FliL family protein [Pseudomonadales bacterium]